MSKGEKTLEETMKSEQDIMEQLGNIDISLLESWNEDLSVTKKDKMKLVNVIGPVLMSMWRSV